MTDNSRYIFDDPNIPDKLKADMLLMLLKCRNATDIHKMRECFISMISIIDECIALDGKKELE